MWLASVRNGLQIRRPKLKSNLLNEAGINACLSRFDNGSYTRLSATPSEGTPSHYSPVQTVTARTKTSIRCRRRQLQLVRRRDGRISDR